MLLALALLGVCVVMGSVARGSFDTGWLGHNGARYAHIARNYVRDGLMARAAPRQDVAAPQDGRPSAPPAVYSHHPPGLALALAAVFALTGVNEQAAALVPMLATLLALWALYRLVAGEAGARAGALAVAVAAALPMVSVYGAHIDVQGSPVAALSLATLLAYRHVLRGGSVGPLLAATAAASAFDWYGLYMPVLCALHLAFVRRALWPAAGLVAFALTLFAAWWLWLASLPGVGLDTLWRAAAVRGPGLLAADGERLGAALLAWWQATWTLMPGWPLLLAAALAVAVGRVQLAPPADAAPSADGTRPLAARPAGLGARALTVLLLAPPLLHAAVFPAGALVHDYWLFGLPYGLAAGAALVALRWPRGFVWAALALLALRGGLALPLLEQRRDELPVRIGLALAEFTQPGDVILTNYETNPFAPGEGDEHVDMRPAVRFYSDRAVRGAIRSAAGLTEALRRRPDATWFLAVPWPESPDPELLAALAARASAAPQRLHADPPVELFRLAP